MKAREGCDLKTLSLLGNESTRTLPTVCRTTAELVATEALMWLAGTTKNALRDREMALSLYGHRVWCTDLPRSLNCRCPHDRWSLVDLAERPTDLSLKDLLQHITGAEDGGTSAHPQIRSELPWITAAKCGKCGQTKRIHRFARLGEPVSVCPCGAQLVADRLGMTGFVIPETDLEDCVTSPLTDLGIDEGSSIGISVGDDWTYFFVDGSLEASVAVEPLPNSRTLT